MTVIAIAAKNKNILLDGMSGSVEKHMLANPRRVGKLIVTINIPEKLSKENADYFEQIGNTNCPISKSIHPDIEVITTFNFVAL
jgi:putative redox protein